jgi:hypothetical protein
MWNLMQLVDVPESRLTEKNAALAEDDLQARLNSLRKE